MMEKILVLLLCREDVTRQWLDARLLVLLAMWEAGRTAWQGRLVPACLTAFLPGILLFVISVLSGEALGEGDALLFWGLGFGRQAGELIGLMSGSFLLAGIFGGWLWFRRGRGGGRQRIAFLPFVTVLLLCVPPRGI